MSGGFAFGGGANCDGRIEAGAYVLGSLDDGERREYAAHLRECAYCREDVERLQPTVDVLAREVAAETMGAELRGRIMAQVRSEAELLAAAGSSADTAPGLRERHGARRRRAASSWSRRTAAFGVPALAACAIAIGLLVGGGGSGSGGLAPTQPVHPFVALRGGQANLIRTGTRAELIVHGLPQPSAGRIYQVWLARRTGQPIPTDVLFSVGRDGSGTADVPMSLRGITRMMVTAEPMGGSTHPTSTPIIVADVPRTV